MLELQRLLKLGVCIPPFPFSHISIGHKFECADLIYKQWPSITVSDLDAAILKNHSEALKWMLAKGARLTTGHFEICFYRRNTNLLRTLIQYSPVKLNLLAPLMIEPQVHPFLTSYQQPDLLQTLLKSLGYHNFATQFWGVSNALLEQQISN